MTPFAKLSAAAAGKSLRFLVIGGHAVIEHGFQRATEDADILVSKNDRDRWLQLAAELGYRPFHDGGNFIQLKSDNPSDWDLDFMLVSAETFERLIAAARNSQVEGAAVMFPSLEHLLALKLHALKHGRGLRVLKDITDVAQLIAANGVDSNSAWLRSLFEKHCNLETYERVLKLLR
jgi:predicted nucleotidyltransferase